MDSQNRKTSRLVEELTVANYLERAPGKRGDGSILVIVPAYNEAQTIADVLSEIPREIGGRRTEVLAVVDGATDETREIVESRGYLPAINLVNQGAGAAQRVGYRIALKRRSEVAVTCDADGQHPPFEIPSLVEPILRDQADIVIGSRVLGDNDDRSLVRDWGRHFYSWLISRFVGQKVTDCSSSFRAVRCSWIEKLDLRQDRFPAAEFVMEAIGKGARYMEVPVHMRRRRHGVSKMPRSRIKFGWNVLRVILGAWWR
jgi:glycosyltransferase involved in cell wall biosynthesis